MTVQRIRIMQANPPVFVSVYEALYDEITNGTYQPGEQLPPETALAERYGVSRGSIRQALAILREDGLIYNHQGKGNFVSQSYEQLPQGFEHLDNPAFSAAWSQCDEVTVYYNYSPPAAVVQEKLKISASELTINGNLVYSRCGKPISHAFMEVPVKFIAAHNINLSDDDSVEQFLNYTLFQLASTAASRITFTVAEESTGQFLQVPPGTQVIFIEEILYSSIGEAIGLCKYYLLPEYYRIHIVRKK